tara:strand:- start:4679 stop:5923 length:1245 start_codon:yes stop_codon:yes gene_type:complete
MHEHGISKVVVGLLVAWTVGHLWLAGWRNLDPESSFHDSETYLAAASAYNSGASPYVQEHLSDRSVLDTGTPTFPFIYPPPYLAFTSWSSHVSRSTYSKLWFLLNALGLATTAIVWIKLLRPMPNPAVAVLIPIACSTSLVEHFVAGQSNLIVLGLASLAVLALKSDRPFLAGIVLGATLGLKPILLPTLVLMLIPRGRRRLAEGLLLGYALTLAVFVIASLCRGLGHSFVMDLIAKYHFEAAPTSFLGTHLIGFLPRTAFANISIAGSLEAIGLSRMASLLLSILTVMSVYGGLLARRDSISRKDPMFQAAALAAPLLVGTYVFDHHVVLALPALAVCVGWSIHDRKASRIVLVTALVAGASMSIRSMHHHFESSSPPTRILVRVTKALCCAGAALGAVVLIPRATRPRSSSD